MFFFIFQHLITLKKSVNRLTMTLKFPGKSMNFNYKNMCNNDYFLFEFLSMNIIKFNWFKVIHISFSGILINFKRMCSHAYFKTQSLAQFKISRLFQTLFFFTPSYFLFRISDPSHSMDANLVKYTIPVIKAMIGYAIADQVNDIFISNSFKNCQHKFVFLPMNSFQQDIFITH